MNGFLDYPAWLHSIAESPWCLTALCKITIVLALAWAFHTMLRGKHPRWRVILWRSAIAGVVVVAGLDALRLVSVRVAVASPARIAVVTPDAVDDNAIPAFAPAPATASALRRYSTPELSRASNSEVAISDIAPVAATSAALRFSDSFAWLYTTILTIWIGGVVCLMMRWVLSKLRLRSIVADSRPAAEWIRCECRRLCRDMGIKPCRVVEVDFIGSPCLGWHGTGPVLLIPSAISDSADPDEMTAILTHELSHLRSHDLHWNYCVNAITGLLWPHPLCWAIGSAHRGACEEVADAESVRRLGATELYTRTLAKVALSVTAQQRPVGLAMARVSDIRRRLDRVRKTFELLPLSRRQIATSIGLAATAFLLLGTLRIVDAAPPADEPQANQADSEGQRPIIVSVGDSDGKPIDGATLQAWRYNPDNLLTPESFHPESLGDGKYNVTFPSETRALRLEVKAPHFVPSMAMWREDELSTELGNTFEFRMAKGTEISGRVVDERGKAIEGATIFVLASSGTRDRERPQEAVYEYPVKTGADGRWICDVIPADATKILLKLTHPDFISDAMYGQTAGDVIIDQLRNGTQLMVMKKGVTVTGRVVDADGKPVQGAMVYQGSDRFGSDFPKTETDANGKFAFRNSKPGEMVLTVVANNLAPDLKEIQVSPELNAVEFRLEPGSTLRLRAIGADRKPLSGIYVGPDTWRGHRSLADLEVPRTTNESGIYVWENAPSDEVTYSMIATGYLDKRNHKLTAREEEYLIEFSRPLTVSGTVVDAKTKQPIEAFDVIQGIKLEQKDSVTWERDRSKFDKAGQYESRFEYPYPGHLVRIEAIGYEPAESRVFQSDEGTVTLDFELNPIAAVQGIVATADGRPAARAQIVLATKDQRVIVENGRLTDLRDQTVAISDADGKFELPSQSESYDLLFLHDFGAKTIVSEDFKTGQTVELLPWASVRGTVMIGTELAVQTGVFLGALSSTPNDPIEFQISSITKTDDRGRYSFSRVLPNSENLLVRDIPIGSVGQVRSHRQWFFSKAGQDAVVNIGGTGRPVVGHVTIPENDTKYAWSIGAILPNLENYPFPAGLDEIPLGERRNWIDEWARTVEGFPFRKKSWQSFAVVVEDDGKFRVEDIPAGDYRLSLSIHAKVATDQYRVGESLGSLTHNFTVPEMPGGRNHQPLDLGDLTLELHNFDDVDDPAAPRDQQ